MELSCNLHAPVPTLEGKVSVTYGRRYMSPRKSLNLRAKRIIIVLSGVELQKSNLYFVAVHGTVHCLTLVCLGVQRSPFFLFMAQQPLVD
jgi:hypothetical protein